MPQLKLPGLLEKDGAADGDFTDYVYDASKQRKC